MQTGRTRYSKNMNTVVFSCMNFELTSIKQKVFNGDLIMKVYMSSHLNLVYCNFYMSSYMSSSSSVNKR